MVENAQAISLGAAAFISLIMSRRSRKQYRKADALFYLVAGLGLVFYTFEELNWLQGFFDYATPAVIKTLNAQEEMSIHNLKPFHQCLRLGYMVVGLAGMVGGYALDRLLVPPSHFLRKIFPPWYLSSYFLILFSVYVTISLISPLLVHVGFPACRMENFLIWRDQEPAELVLTLAVLFHFMDQWIKMRMRNDAPHPADAGSATPGFLQ